MDLILIEYFDFGDTFTGAHLLSRSNFHKAQLSADGCFHYQIAQTLCGPFILLTLPLHIGSYQIFADDGHGRIVAKTFALQFGILHLVIVFVFRHFELCFTLDAHAEFFFVQRETFFQACQFVIGFQRLLFQAQAFLFHFDFFLLISDALLLPVVPLVFDATQQVRIREGQNRISFLEQTAFLGYDTLYASRFTGVYFNGENRLYQSFHIDVFHKLVIFDFGYLYVFRLDAELARPGRQNDDVNKESDKCNSSGYVEFIADVPGFLFNFNIHIILFFRFAVYNSGQSISRS